MKIKLYGINNCNTVRLAKKWLDSHHLAYRFEDIRQHTVASETWKSWLQFWSVDKLINKRSTSWKLLPEDQKKNLSIENALHLLQLHPTLMKRPHLVVDNRPELLGFSDATYQQLFSDQR